MRAMRIINTPTPPSVYSVDTSAPSTPPSFFPQTRERESTISHHHSFVGTSHVGGVLSSRSPQGYKRFFKVKSPRTHWGGLQAGTATPMTVASPISVSAMMPQVGGVTGVLPPTGNIDRGDNTQGSANKGTAVPPPHPQLMATMHPYNRSVTEEYVAANPSSHSTIRTYTTETEKDVVEHEEGETRELRASSDVATSTLRLEVFQKNFLKLITDPTYEQLFDIVIAAEGKEIRSHRAILAASSDYFHRLFCGTDPPNRIEFQQRWQIVRQLIHCIYGAEMDPQIDPELMLEVLAEARNLEINRMLVEYNPSLMLSNLNPHNAVAVLLHEETIHHPELARQVCLYVADHFWEILKTPSARSQLLQLPHPQCVWILRRISSTCRTTWEAEATVRFAVEWSHFETACDLLRDCKQWEWRMESDATGFSFFRDAQTDTKMVDEGSSSNCGSKKTKQIEWRIDNLKVALRDRLPMKCVCGKNFDWSVRIDHGAEGKIRIVYESAIMKFEDANSAASSSSFCIKRFPAAMFAWQVIFRGANVFHERPVFICFPEHVSLHWSTTLSVVTNELRDDDSLTLFVNLIENPLVSLILYHFSANLSNTISTEDILNRLPHIEYRCLSSYSLFHQVCSTEPKKEGVKNM